MFILIKCLQYHQIVEVIWWNLTQNYFKIKDKVYPIMIKDNLQYFQVKNQLAVIT